MPERGGFEGKVVLVTGAGSGIGKASAIAFARAAAQVVIADVDAERGDQVAQTICAEGGEARFVRVNITKADEVASMLDCIVKIYGQLDYAHNNAGILGDIGKMTDCTEANWDQVLTTNLKGTWLCLKHELTVMQKQGRGAIVNTASIYGLVGAPQGLSAYVASKHGIIGLTRTVALEYARTGIRVNAVCPSVVSTPMIEPFLNHGPEVEANFRASHPLNRLATPEEIAQASLWLCSDAAAFMTGHALVIDGGYTVR